MSMNADEIPDEQSHPSNINDEENHDIDEDFEEDSDSLNDFGLEENDKTLWERIKSERAKLQLENKFPPGSDEYEDTMDWNDPQVVESHFAKKESRLLEMYGMSEDESDPIEFEDNVPFDDDLFMETEKDDGVSNDEVDDNHPDSNVEFEHDATWEIEDYEPSNDENDDNMFEELEHFDDGFEMEMEENETDERSGLFKRQMDEKIAKVLNEDDETDFHIGLSFKQTHKNAKTIEQRRYNAATEGVVMAFIPEQEVGKQRCSFYKLENEKGHQGVNDMNAEYDLLNYPLFFPEGGRIRMGWSPYTPQIDESTINISEYYERVCREFGDVPVESSNVDDQLAYISEKLGYTVTRQQFIFDGRCEPKEEEDLEDLDVTSSIEF